LVSSFVWGMPSGRTKISPKSGRGLGHVTPTFLAYGRTYLQNYLSSRLQIWYTALYGEWQAGAQKISLKSGRGLGHVTATIFVSTVGYPSDSLASCQAAF